MAFHAQYPVKKHITYATVIAWFGDPDFRFTRDAGTKSWLGAGKDAAYYYLGMVQDGMAHVYYYAAIVLRNDDQDVDATANLHTSPLLIGFRDAKVSAVAKEAIKKYPAVPNPGIAD